MPNPHQNDPPVVYRHGLCKIVGNEGSGAYRVTEMRWTGSAWTEGLAPGACVAPDEGTPNAYDANGVETGAADAIVPFRQAQKSTGGRAYIIDACYAEPPILYGRPTGAFSSGTTVTLDPCDVYGADNGLPNRSVYVQASQASLSMSNSTTLPTSAIVPHIRLDATHYYIFGQPIEVVTNLNVDMVNLKLQKKTRISWGSVAGTESDWVDVHTGTACA